VKKKRFSFLTLLGIACLVSAGTIFALAHFGGIKPAITDDVVKSETVPAPQIKPASWFDNRPASFADLAERVSPAVVNISTQTTVKNNRQMPFRQFGPNDPFNDFFNRFFDQMPEEEKRNSLGSGVIIEENGTILTNNHVISGADQIEVKLKDGRKYKAIVVGTDEKTDVAVIKIKEKAKLPTAVLGDSDSMRPGDWTMAIGNPFGLEQTVTVGVVSATGRVIGGGPYAKFIQTDASINPGNSGGPLFNLKGEVIGINTMIYATGQGIGFAIPINLAKQIAPQLEKDGKVTRGWLGVSIQEITPELAKSFGIKDEDGALIAEVFDGSPAAKLGIKRGDVITMFDGQKINDPYDLSLTVGNTIPGKEVDVIVLREGKEVQLKGKIGMNEDERLAEASPSASGGKADVLGLVTRSLSESDFQRYELPKGTSGVVIERVEPGSSAEAADVRSGDILLEMNGAKVTNMSSYKDLIKKLEKGKVVRLFLKRGIASIFVAFPLN